MARSPVEVGRSRKLPNTATKEELAAAHRGKMMGKFFRNREFGSYLPETPEERALRLNFNRELGRK